MEVVLVAIFIIFRKLYDRGKELLAKRRIDTHVSNKKLSKIQSLLDVLLGE